MKIQRDKTPLRRPAPAPLPVWLLLVAGLLGLVSPALAARYQQGERVQVTGIVSGRDGRPIELRIGIGSGPAVAGVIGTSKFIYDLWGDTVNTASRMESHGVPGRVQVCAVTRQLLDGQYEFEVRGPVEVKGLGTVDTWFLVGD